ncbi:MAG TPA: CoA pyrophosphatase [Gemmatimonadales bacterium]|nr:CoA pyrophosphatase [Gemmatimonadales bacterium]
MTLEGVRRALARYVPEPDDGPGAAPAAVAVILHQGAGGIEALFIHRAERAGDVWSGQIAFPGGRRDPGDRDLLATAVRETREEIGVDLSRVERLGTLSDLRPRTPVLPPIYVRPFVFAVTERPPIALSPEVQGVFWVPFRRLLEPGVHREVTIEVGGIERSFPAYSLGGQVIWGMTERILTALLELVS